MSALRRSNSTELTELAPSRPSSVREALLAEALGDLHALLQKVDSLRDELEEARIAMAATVRDMTRDVDSFKHEVQAVTEVNKRNALSFLMTHTKAVTQQLLAVQALAMSKSAHDLFEKELEPQLRRMALTLKQQSEQQRTSRDTWYLYACIAMLAATSFVQATFPVYLQSRPATMAPEPSQSPPSQPSAEAPAIKPAPQKSKSRSP